MDENVKACCADQAIELRLMDMVVGWICLLWRRLDTGDKGRLMEVLQIAEVVIARSYISSRNKIQKKVYFTPRPLHIQHLF